MVNDAPMNIDGLTSSRTMPLVLIAEREAIIAADLADCLEGCGRYKTVSAHTAENAETLAMELMPDVLLMDSELCGERCAMETAKKIKEMLRIPTIVAVSSTPAWLLYELERNVNPTCVIRKPADDDMLLDSIACALRGERNAYAKALFHRLNI